MPGFTRDIQSWCDKTGNTLLKTTFENKQFKAYIQYVEKKRRQHRNIDEKRDGSRRQTCRLLDVYGHYGH